jgi:hypothetical protein
MEIKQWVVGTKVCQHYKDGRKRFGTVTEVTPHKNGDSWIDITFDDNLGKAAGTQSTLMGDNINNA